MNLPKVFQNKKISLDDNHQSYYYSNLKSDNNINRTSNVEDEINNIFNNKFFIYKAKVEIELSDKKVVETLVGKNKSYLITINNELIPIKDIKGIKKLD